MPTVSSRTAAALLNAILGACVLAWIALLAVDLTLPHDWQRHGLHVDTLAILITATVLAATARAAYLIRAQLAALSTVPRRLDSITNNQVGHGLLLEDITGEIPSVRRNTDGKAAGLYAELAEVRTQVARLAELAGERYADGYVDALAKQPSAVHRLSPVTRHP